jgi:WD40 repeat protein
MIVFLKLAFPLGVILHNVSERKPIRRIQGAHKGKVSGLCFAQEDRLLSCGVDSNIKLWDATPQNDNDTIVRFSVSKTFLAYLSQSN